MVSYSFGGKSFGFSCIFSSSGNKDGVHSSKNTADERSSPDGLSRSNDREVIDDRKRYIEPRDMVGYKSTGARPLDFPVFVFFAQILRIVNFHLLCGVPGISTHCEAMEASILDESFDHGQFDISLSFFGSFCSFFGAMLENKHLRGSSSESDCGQHYEESRPKEAVEGKAPSYVEVVKITAPKGPVFLLDLFGVFASLLISNPPVLDDEESDDVQNNVY